MDNLVRNPFCLQIRVYMCVHVCVLRRFGGAEKKPNGVAASARTLELKSLPARPSPAVATTKRDASKTRPLQLAQKKEAVDVPREQRDQDEHDAV